MTCTWQSFGQKYSCVITNVTNADKKVLLCKTLSPTQIFQEPIVRSL